MRTVLRRLDADLLYDARASTAERPVWDQERGRLLWVDVPAGDVHALDAGGRSDTVILHLDEPVGFAMLRAGGGLVLGTERGFQLFDAGLASPSETVPVRRTNATVRMNDGLCDPWGRAWGGTLDKRGDGAALYCLEREGEEYCLRTAVSNARESNGLDWSVDGRTLYWIDTATGRVDRFDYAVETGAATNRRPFVSIDRQEGVPDGLIVDAEDGVWVAVYGGGVVRRYDASGAEDLEVRLPVRRPTCPTFGGPGLSRLFITTQRVNPDDPSYQDDARAGGIFVCEPGIAGRPARAFAGRMSRQGR